MQTPKLEIHHLPTRVRIFQFNGAFAFWGTRQEAWGFIERGSAVVLGWPRKITGIRFAPQPGTVLPNDCSGRRLSLSNFVGQRYSDTREAQDNPPRCWRLKPVAAEDRALFITSLTDCITP